MNERFNELRLDAGIALLHNEPLLVVVNKDGTVNQCPLEGLEKFAELIVRECIQVGGPEDSYTDEWFKAKADSVAKIKKHFGVEE